MVGWLLQFSDYLKENGNGINIEKAILLIALHSNFIMPHVVCYWTAFNYKNSLKIIIIKKNSKNLSVKSMTHLDISFLSVVSGLN